MSAGSGRRGGRARGHDRGQDLAVAVSAPPAAWWTSESLGRHRWNSSHSSSGTSGFTIDTRPGSEKPKEMSSERALSCWGAAKGSQP
jgi:hypothetical protein